MNKPITPKTVCEPWARAIRAGVRKDLASSPNGRLTSEQVQEYRNMASECHEFHERMEEIAAKFPFSISGLERK